MKFPCLFCLLTGLALLSLSESAKCAVFNVANGDIAALKAAINTSNTNGQDDTIELAATGNYPLTAVDNTNYGGNGLPILGADGGKSLTIHGNGATILRSTTAGTPQFRIFNLSVGANVTMSQLSIVNGDLRNSGVAGGIYNDHATLALSNCAVTGNQAGLGGGIFSNASGSSGNATVTAVDSIFDNNVVSGSEESFPSGGAIYNKGANNTGETGQARLTITRCTFSNNSAPVDGGGIDNFNSGALVTVIISDSTFEGNSAGGGSGGAISNGGFQADATMVITNSIFRTNSSGDPIGGGGAVLNAAGNLDRIANLTVNSCTFTGNTSQQYGGGIWNFNTGGVGGTSILAVTDCTFANNQTVRGGALASYQRMAPQQQQGRAGFTVTNSTFNDNSSCCRGGAIFVLPASVTPQLISNCTFTGNTVSDTDPATHGGGAIYLYISQELDATVTVKNCTFSQNSAPVSGGGISNFGFNGRPTLLLSNTILQTGPAGANIYNGGGTIISQGYNLSNDNGSGVLVAAGDQPGVNTLLDPAGLQNHGGPTQTVALLANSPAINTGDPNAPARDQRYYLRNGAPDIGAFEYGGTLAPLTTVSRKTHGAAGPFDVDLPLSGNAGLECRSGGASGDHQLIMTFATPVTATSASITNGAGSVSGVSGSGSQMTVDLTGVANAQQITLTFSGLSDGTNTNNLSIPMRVLLGDTNGNGAVNASDVGQTKAQIGHPVTSSNFRNDLNVNGAINASDVSIVKSRIGTSVAVAPQGAEVARDIDRDLKTER